MANKKPPQCAEPGCKKPVSTRTKVGRCSKHGASFSTNLRRHEREVAGLCKRCGDGPPEPGKLECTGCLRSRNAQAASRIRRLAAKKICTRAGCGKPAVPLDSGKPGRLCKKHRTESREKMRIWLVRRRLDAMTT